MRKNFYRQAQKGICIATLSATVLTSIPTVSYAEAYAKGRAVMEEMQKLSLPTENAVTFNLADAALRQEKTFVDAYGEDFTTTVIEINIAKNGTYIIKGSNEINNAFVDTHIKVEKGVEANIIFDGAQIQNNQMYDSGVDSCGNIYTNQLFPVLDIEGTANLYVEEDSCLTSPDKDYSYVIQVTGDMTLKEGNGRLTLMLGNCKEDSEEEENYGYSILGRKEGENRRQGTVTLEGGDLVAYGAIEGVEKFTMTGGKADLSYGDGRCVYAEDIAILGGELSLTDDAEKEWISYFLKGRNSVYIDGAKITAKQKSPTQQSVKIGIVESEGSNTVICNSVISYDEQYFTLNRMSDVSDVYGRKIGLFTVDGLLENTKVKTINGQPVTNLQTAEDGTLKCFMEYGKNIITLEDGSVYTYTYQLDGENAIENMIKDDPAVSTHKITLQVEGETNQQEFVVPDGFKLGNRYFDGQRYYEYDYGSAGTPDKITEDMMITLREVELGVTVDGEKFEGDVLPNEVFYLAQDRNGDSFVAYPGDTVKQGASYTSSLPAVKKDGKWFVKIGGKADFDSLDELLQEDDALKILLDADIDFSEEDVFGLLNGGASSFYGIFDGNGHSITNVKSKYYPYILTGNNYGTIKNVRIRNATVPSRNYSADFRSGILCSNNYGTIENCAVENAVIKTKKKTEYDDEMTIKLRVHSALAGGNYGTIKDSFVKDITFDGDGDTYPLSQSFTGSHIENTYYLSEKTEDKNAKTAQQFASGEVCSLLNHGVSDGSQCWYQNIDNDGEKDQAPVADSSHGTVYTGYQECVKSYSNVKLPESPTAHDTIYTAQGNVITGICKKDSAHSVRMTVSGKDAVYDKTAHAVDIGIELSEEWGKVEVPYEIFYTREGTRTEDLTSPGTIKATVSVGTAKVEVVYTIKEAPTEKPVVTPTAKPTDKPAATPTAKPTDKPAVTPTAKPTDKPVATPTAKPTKTSDSQATKKAAEREKAVPKKVGAILKVKGNKYRVTKSKAKGSTVEFTGYTNKKKKKVTIPESITVQGVEYDVTSIGERAFSNCKKLTLLEIKTKKLTKKTVAKKTFKSIRKKTVIKVPKSKYKAYKKVLRARGLNKKVKIKK